MSEVFAEANRIKDRLRACTSEAEVVQVAAEERAVVMTWTDTTDEKELVKRLKAKPDDRGLMFLHIVWLKRQLITGFREQEQGRAA
ncbi:hypothetical protein [Leisingera sp. M523]|uniref:hypothetical protein n=1 Tax=Leisingera sp. M523 TaxID=2867013 RepID=UPI0021A344AD|nr:hypothetical protein [Leisingera sp. M523]UWQ30237.1 hypothetical protein K3557_06790 [Leisingera sp. M523]